MLDLKNVAIVDTGVRDGLGDRLTGFDRVGGQTLQILRVRPELAAFGVTLDEVVARFTERSDRHVLNARGVVRDGARARPLVVFEHIEGERLDDILARAHALSVIPDITVALFLANHLLTALAALARTTQAAHGALSLNRILVTPRGRIVIAEHVFGPLLEQLAFSHTRLWHELRVAMPEEPVPALCDYRADVAQVAVITLSLILGRPLEENEYPDRLEDLLAEVREVAWIRAGDVLANAVGSWLDLALPLPGRLIFDEASQAKEALGSMLPADQNFVGSRADLHAFLKQIAEAEASGEAELTESPDAPPTFEVVSASGETILVTSADGQDEDDDALEDAGEDESREDEVVATGLEIVGDGSTDLVAEAAGSQEGQEEEPVIELSADLLDELKSFGIVLPSAQAAETSPEPVPAEEPPALGADATSARASSPDEEPAAAALELQTVEPTPTESPIPFVEPPPTEAPAPEPMAVEPIAAAAASTDIEVVTQAIPPVEHPLVAVGQEAWFDLDTPVEAPIDEAPPVAELSADTPMSIGAWRTEPSQALPAVVVETSEGWFDLDSPIEAPIGSPLPLVADLPVTEQPRFERDSVAEKAAREKVAAETQDTAGVQPSDESPATDVTVAEIPSVTLAGPAATPVEEAAEVPPVEAFAEESAAREAEAAAPIGIADIQEAVSSPTEAPALDAGHEGETPTPDAVLESGLPPVEPAAAELTVEPVEPEFELFAEIDKSHPHANLEAWFELEPPLPAPDETSLFGAFAPPDEPAVPASTERLPAIDLGFDAAIVERFEPIEPVQAEPAAPTEVSTFDAVTSEPVEATGPAAPVVESFDAPAPVAPDTQAVEVAPEPVQLYAAEQPPEPAVEAPLAQDEPSAEPEAAELEPKAGAFASFLADVKALISKIKGPEDEEAEPVDGDRVEWEQRSPHGATDVEAPPPAEVTEAGALVAETATEAEPSTRARDAFAVTVPIEESVAEPGFETGPEPESFEVLPSFEEPVATPRAEREPREPEPAPPPSQAAAAASEPVVEIALDAETAVPGTTACEEPPALPVDGVIAAVDEAIASGGPPAEPAPAVDAPDPLADAVALLEEVVARTAAPASQLPPPAPKSAAPQVDSTAVAAREPAAVESARGEQPAAPKPVAPAEREPAAAAAPEKKRSRRSRHRKRKKAGARPDAAPATIQAGVPATPPAMAVEPPVFRPAPTPVAAATMPPLPPAPAPVAMAGPATRQQVRPPSVARPAAEAPAARSSLISDPEAATMRQWMVSGDDTPVVPVPQQKSLNIATPGTAPPSRQSLISDADATIIRDWTATEGDGAEAPPPAHRPFAGQPPGRPAPPTLRPIAPPAPAAAAVSSPALPTVPIRPDLSAERTATTKARDSAEEVALKARVRALIDNELKVAEPEPAESPALSMGPPKVEKPSRWTWMRIAAALVVLVGGAVAAGSQLLGSRVRPGTVIVESTPPESEVFLDGSRSGQTPVTLKVSPGEHALEVRYDGHRQTMTLSIGSGDEITQSFDWATLTPIGALEVTSDPPGARVLVDGKVAGETPLKLDGLSIGEHSVTVDNDSGSVTSPVHITEDEIAKLNVPIFSGWLAVFAPVELQIFEKGRLLGTTTDSRIMVRPGVHNIELRNEAYNYRALETVEVKPGEVKALSYEPKGRVNLNAEPWAEVSVDGKRVGETPLANVLVTIGTREFVFRHPQLGERRVTAVVTVGQTKLVNVDMNSR